MRRRAHAAGCADDRRNATSRSGWDRWCPSGASRGVGVLDSLRGDRDGALAGRTGARQRETWCTETVARAEARSRSRRTPTRARQGGSANSEVACRHVLPLRSRFTDAALPRVPSQAPRRPTSTPTNQTPKGYGTMRTPRSADTGLPRRRRRSWLVPDTMSARRWPTTVGGAAGAHGRRAPAHQPARQERILPGRGPGARDVAGVFARSAAEHEGADHDRPDHDRRPRHDEGPRVSRETRGPSVEMVRRSARGPRRSPPGGRAWGAHRSRTSRARRRSRR